MYKGDISNQFAPTIAFSFENVICKSFKKKLFKYEYELDRQVLGATNKFYWKDFRIAYVTFKIQSNKLIKLEEELEEKGCLFSDLIGAPDIETLRDYLSWNSIAYFDTNKDTISKLYPYGYLWTPTILSIWTS